MIPLQIQNKIPSPPSPTFSIAGLQIHYYGLFISCGFLIATFIASYIWVLKFRQNKKDVNPIFDLLIVVLPSGIVGARLYYVITMWNLYQDNWIDIFKIYEGGLGILGGLMGGLISVVVFCRLKKIDFLQIASCIAPTVPLAQGIGRIGNWFNVELYGKETDLPWGLDISRGKYSATVFYHPTFLYEIIWDLLIFAILMLLFFRFRNFRKISIPLYLMFYTFGRFWVEQLRIDESNYLFGIRLNIFFIMIVFCASAIWCFVSVRFLFRSQPIAQNPDKH